MEFLRRRQLVDLLCEVPASQDFAGRTALFAGLPELKRNEAMARTDLNNAVEQLESLGGDALLTRLIDNVLGFIQGAPLAARVLALRPSLSRAELQISAADFDLVGQQQSLLDAALAGRGLVGCAIRTHASVVQRVLTERLRDQLGPANLSLKEPVMLSPTNPVASCVKSIARYRAELARRDVLVPVWAFSTDSLAALWGALSTLMAGGADAHNLLVLCFVDDAVALPAGLAELEPPRVRFADLFAWTLACLRKIEPPPADAEGRARRWSRALMTACTDADGTPIDRVFEALDGAVEALKSDASAGAIDRLTGGSLA